MLRYSKWTGNSENIWRCCYELKGDESESQRAPKHVGKVSAKVYLCGWNRVYGYHESTAEIAFVTTQGQRRKCVQGRSEAEISSACASSAALTGAEEARNTKITK